MISAVALFQPAFADDGHDGDWEYSASLYLWGAGIEGSLANGAEVDASFSDILEQLEFAIMGHFEARQDKWTVLADAIWMDLAIEDDASIPPPAGPGAGASLEADADVEGTIFNLLGGYQLMKQPGSRLDLLFGARYLDLDLSLEADLTRVGNGQQRSRAADGNQDVVDAVVGLRGTAQFSDNWYYTYLFDVGTGDSDLTWQALASIGYRYGWGDLALAYRHLDWEFDSGEPIEDIQFSGPALQARWNF